MSDNELNQPLNQSTASDSASVSSQGSRGGSLLERIKAQREREAAMKASSTSSNSNHGSSGSNGGVVDMELTVNNAPPHNPVELAESGLQPPSASGSMEVSYMQPQPPMYGPISNNDNGFDSQQPPPQQPSGGLLSRMFGRFRHVGSSHADARESLLEGGEHHEDVLDLTASEEHYSMAGYFQTFIHDIYSLFRSIHPIVQVGLVLIMIFLVVKLI
mmetsp:Transcript_10975/g.13210  ORF Transcript_10975/g.13210 Transcript_10975/m.13210 type:complete len:216 (-) Transcript_10975:203-850(-)